MYFVLLLSFGVLGCGQLSADKHLVDYSNENMWAFLEENPGKRADLFIVAPTIYFGDENTFNMPIDDEENCPRIIGALNMQLGIYNQELNVYSPYYRQASFSSIYGGNYDEAKLIGYSDVSAAFEYYMNNINDGRPFVIVGFSQGADMCISLIKEYPEYLEKMIATYIYGRSIRTEEIERYPQLVSASGEDDTGVVICFNSEAIDINDTFTIPAGTTSICINPLNWKTDETMADKSLNMGSVFVGYDGEVINEISQLTGAYIDRNRGVLKLTDVNPDEYYYPELSFLEFGEYHLYEYMFFYRNLQENVKTRVESYFDKQ